jgi:hypothetical protein
VVHHEAFATQEDQQTSVAEPTALAGQCHQPLAQPRIMTPARPVAHRYALAADQSARPPLAHLMDARELSDGLSLGSGRHLFFVSRSFSAALSRCASARSFFSFAFSPSSAFSRLAPTRPAPETALPVVERRLADPVLAAQIGRLRSSLVLLQHPDDLLFAEPRSLHRLALSQRARLNFNLD